MAKLRPVGHDERLELTDHLDELRTRIIVSILVFAVAAGFCFWQNDLIIELMNRPLPGNREPITLSPTEPFFTTLKLVSYAALLLSLPILLYQAYAFILPAFSPTERRVALPLLLMVPVLFVGGVLFAYFVILPPAITFLLGFNAESFDTQLRASEYYGFAALSLISVGILFQIPVAVLAACKLGVTTPEKLRRNRKYAVLIIAVLAMLLPGQDPITMVLAMLPLVLLFEFSVILAGVLGRPPEAIVEDRVAGAEGS
jgi:sec-independent protein translocase protein TatC